MDKDYKDLKAITWVVMALITIIPYIVYQLTTNIHIQAIETSNDWIGFWGSFIPAMFSSLVTLWVLKVTTVQTRKIQEENMSNENNRRRVEFIDRITTLVGEYCSNMLIIHDRYTETSPLQNEVSRLTQEVHDYEKNERTGQYCIQEGNRFYIKNIDKLKQELEEKSKQLRIERQKRDIEIDQIYRNKSKSIYYTLQMLLGGEKNANNVLEQLEKIEQYYIGIPLNNSTLEKEIEELLKLMVKFCAEINNNNS